MKNIIILALMIALFSGCTTPIARKEAPPPSPREEASSRLIEEGKELLQAGNYDAAIRLFEQAVGLNSNNGQGYYYLAQAWMEKGVLSEAKEFNNLAQIYLKDDSDWKMRVEKQADQISSLEQ